MKLPRKKIFASGRGRCRTANRIAHRKGEKPIRLGRCASSLVFRRAIHPTPSRASRVNSLSEQLGQQFIVENRPGAGR